MLIYVSSLLQKLPCYHIKMLFKDNFAFAVMVFYSALNFNEESNFWLKTIVLIWALAAKSIKLLEMQCYFFPIL